MKKYLPAILTVLCLAIPIAALSEDITDAESAFETGDVELTAYAASEIEDAADQGTDGARESASTMSDDKPAYEEEIITVPEANGTIIAANGSCGPELTWTLDSDGLLTISGTGDMYSWDKGESPFSNPDIKSVSIENGVTSIGDYAFSECGMTAVTLPNSIERIWYSAFSDC